MVAARKGLIVIVSRIPGPPWTVNLPNKPHCGITVPSYLHKMGGLTMPDTLVFTEQIKKLEAFRHGQADSTELDEFDAETEQLILITFREDSGSWLTSCELQEQLMWLRVPESWPA